MLRTHRLLLVWTGVIGLSSCVAPGVQGPGGTVQGTANVENLERQSSVTPAPNDAQNAANAAIYGSGGYRYRGYYYPGCRWGRCYRPYGWY
ncbi:MAG: hypothetical protein ACK2UO_21330 [Caldilineaceae bacterium]|jgi:hypothetical protein